MNKSTRLKQHAYQFCNQNEFTAGKNSFKLSMNLQLMFLKSGVH